MKLDIDGSNYISDIESSDKPAFIEHLKEKQIYDQTLNIPYPYSESDAEEWITIVTEETKKFGRSINWAIRRHDGFLIGGIGFHGLDTKNPYRAELGYWLAKPYWGQGIMTKAVHAVTEFAFKELKLIRVTAHVFDFNKGSARVLEKAGYQFEGCLRKHYRKDDKIFDGNLYAKINTGSTRESILLNSIGSVHSTRKAASDDHWDQEEAFISLDSSRFSTEALRGLTDFSHVEIIFYMNQVANSEVSTGARFPRGNTNLDKVGIFAQRAKGRPNKLGSTICRIKRIEGLNLYVEGLDAIDETPVLDIKPWVQEFGPRGPNQQPQWVSDLMKKYWS